MTETATADAINTAAPLNFIKRIVAQQTTKLIKRG